MSQNLRSLLSALLLSACQLLLGWAVAHLGIVASSVGETSDLPLITRLTLPFLQHGLWVGMLLATGHIAVFYRELEVSEKGPLNGFHLELLCLGIAIFALSVVAAIRPFLPLGSLLTG